MRLLNGSYPATPWFLVLGQDAVYKPPLLPNALIVPFAAALCHAARYPQPASPFLYSSNFVLVPSTFLPLLPYPPIIKGTYITYPTLSKSFY